MQARTKLALKYKRPSERRSKACGAFWVTGSCEARILRLQARGGQSGRMMTKEIKYLSIHDIIEIHEDLQQGLGGRRGVKDREILCSLLEEMSAFIESNKSKDIWEVAAAYICSFTKKRPFFEGNARAACVSGLYFLELNEIVAPLEEARVEELMKKVKAGEMGIPEVASFLKGEDSSEMVAQALTEINQMYSDVLQNLAK